MKAKNRKAKDQPRFDIDMVRDLAGQKVFARGEGYYSDGHVEILVLEPRRVLARVAGTDDYRTELTGRGRAIEGECSCPAFEDRGFCKHIVATALAANDAGSDAEAAGARTLARIHDHLRKQGVDALVGMIVKLAERDAALFRKLEMAAATAHGDDGTLETRLRKAIDGATRTAHYIDYGEARDWADNVEDVLDAIARLVAEGRADLALRLADHVIDRIEGAIKSIDDSDGHGGVLLNHARDIHLAAARVVRPEPIRLARELFAREMGGGYDGSNDTVRQYADVLGGAGLAEFRRLAAEAWGKLPSRNGSNDASSDVNYYALTEILDFFAERDGDVDARIALRAKDLSSSWSYLQLAEFCLEQGRQAEALRRAEEGLWIFEDGEPDVGLVLFTAKLLVKAGRKADAETHLWRAFEKEPTLEIYKRLRKLTGKAAYERAVQFLEARTIKGERIRGISLADLLIEILIGEKMFDAAWLAVRKHKASIDLRLTLAGRTEATHPRETLEVYGEHVEQLANCSGSEAYKKAAKLIGRMAALQSVSDQASYIARLKLRHGRKRNLMKLVG